MPPGLIQEDNAYGATTFCAVPKRSNGVIPHGQTRPMTVDLLMKTMFLFVFNTQDGGMWNSQLYSISGIDVHFSIQ